MKCSLCGKEAINVATEEEMEVQYRREFPDFPEESKTLVCSSCYKLALEFMKTHRLPTGRGE